MRSILVTGATGFIGKAVLRLLRANGNHLRTAGRSRPLPETIGDEPDYVEVGDLGPETDWSNALKDMSAIIHLAGRAHVGACGRDNPYAHLSLYRRVNTLATENLARQAAEAGVRRFVFVSTVLFAGSQARVSPVSETDTPTASNAYSQSKLEAEFALRGIADETGLELVILRPPLVYGPGAPGNFGHLLQAIRRGTPLPLASVRNRRSFIGLSNLCELVDLCVNKPEAAGETFHVSDSTLSTPELVNRIARALGIPARLWPCPPALLRLGGRMIGRASMAARLTESLEVSSTKVRQALGWTPTKSMDEELADTAEWWRRQLEREDLKSNRL